MGNKNVPITIKAEFLLYQCPPANGDQITDNHENKARDLSTIDFEKKEDMFYNNAL